MSKSYVPVGLRRQVSEDAGFRCGYCLTAQQIIGQPLTIDHLVPESAHGQTTRENLWLSCRRCNEFKGQAISAIDPITNNHVPLYNPRTQSWTAHFAWNDDGTRIIGLTAVGRATVIALKLNNEEIVQARALWVTVGWHPPMP